MDGDIGFTRGAATMTSLIVRRSKMSKDVSISIARSRVDSIRTVEQVNCLRGRPQAFPVCFTRTVGCFKTTGAPWRVDRLTGLP